METNEEVRGVSEQADARAGNTADAQMREARPKPGDASSAASSVDAGPPSSAADAAIVDAVDAAAVADAAASGPTESDAMVASDAGTTLDLIDEAFAALRFGQVDKRQSLIDRLDQRVKQRPDDGYALFYAGAFRFWKFAEGTKDLGDLLQNLSLPEETLDRFARASPLLPDDFRVPGFYGMFQVNVGVLTGDSAMTKAGLQVLDKAIAMYPAYGYFLRAMGTSSAPVDDPVFATTMSDMVGIFRECLVEPSEGEVTYTYPRGPKLAARPHICLNDSIIPHVWEGTLISFGDLAAKAGWEAEKVRALYRSARTAPNYADWPFATLLEERIAGAAERVAMYKDANPLNDPIAWGADGHICSGCHQER